ncbi:putative glycoside hydrolase [Planctomycetota bacterium]
MRVLAVIQVVGLGCGLLAGTMSYAANPDLTVDGTLSLSLEERGGDLIEVNAFVIHTASARLEIDLLAYLGGPRRVELVRFAYRRGAFDPNRIGISGLRPGQTASITYDDDSMDLIIAAQAQSASMFWFSLSPGAGTRDEETDDLVLNNGRYLTDLDVPGLSCTCVPGDKGLLYTVHWTGSDFTGDSIGDSLSFDVRVEGFTGSTFTYSPESKGSTMTALGSPTDVTVGDDAWGVGGDFDVGEGQSLRFRVSNLQVSAPGYVAEFQGFTGMTALETNGGRDHRLVFGEGTGLESQVFSTPKRTFTFNAVDPLVVTGAGSFYETRHWAASHIAFKLRVYHPTSPANEDLGDYSRFVTGPTYWDEYPAQQNVSNFPTFSWDRVPRWLIVRKSSAYTDAEVNSMAHSYALIVFEKANKAGFDTIEQGILDTATRIRAVDPNTKNIFYFNSWIHYTGYGADVEYAEHAWDWSNHTVDTNGHEVIDWFKDRYYTHNYAVPEMRDWWVRTTVNMASESVIDGVFVDKVTQSPPSMIVNDEPASDFTRMQLALREGLPAGKLMLGNTLRNERANGNRAHLEIQDGSYMERWHMPNRNSQPAQSEADAVAVSLQLMREALSKGKIILFKTSGPESSPKDFAAAVDYPLALYLIVAEPNAYFAYQASVDARQASWKWDPSDITAFNRPLGPPLGDPVRNGTVYTRSYEHVDVWVDLSTEEAVLNWHDDELRRKGL